MEFRRIVSVKRNEELNRQTETGEDLPEIVEVQILVMLEGKLANTGTFVEEVVKQVFEVLWPRNSHCKTSSDFEIDKRVIVCALENKWGPVFALTIIANSTFARLTTYSTRWTETEPSKRTTTR